MVINLIAGVKMPFPQDLRNNLARTERVQLDTNRRRCNGRRKSGRSARRLVRGGDSSSWTRRQRIAGRLGPERRGLPGHGDRLPQAWRAAAPRNR